MTHFPENAPVAYPVFYRTYSRVSVGGRRESWSEVCDRTIGGLRQLGNLTGQEADLIDRLQRALKCLTSGRWLWVGGTPWIDNPANFSGGYNCTSTNIIDWRSFGLLMDLAMQGSGTGAVLEPKYIQRLPVLRNTLKVEVIGTIGSTPKDRRREETEVRISQNKVEIFVGDSRKGWVKSYQTILELSSDDRFSDDVTVVVDISDIRPSGESLKGFGGVANPVKLPNLYQRCANILNRARGRKLTSVECCLLIDEAAVCVVAGNIRRSAGMRQGERFDVEFSLAKDNLWQQDEHGNWRIDPERDSLRMANHTRVFHQKPTLQETIDAVRKQYYSGEGAIQWAGEAIARSSADILPDFAIKQEFLRTFAEGTTEAWIKARHPQMSAQELEHRLQRYGLNPCGEIIGANFHCNLAEVHLNRLDPTDRSAQAEAFTAGALSVASLLNHRFVEDRYRISRELDPIVGVSFTGLFDFFVHAFGVNWLEWWSEGRPEAGKGQEYRSKEAEYLNYWREVVHQTVGDYCDRHGLKRPNRCTTVQPSGTKSLLTNASPGWHPPKATRFIRRITCRKNDPVAMACLDYGYNIVPSQSDKDEQGNLLNDPFDPRCSEWLIEIPVEVSWAGLPGADTIDISQFSALAQFDFYMQVQKHYTRHNTSATIELRESEIEPLARRIYEAIENDEGYISAALLARFDDLQTFPRLPFEPIDKATYDRLLSEIPPRRRVQNFHEALTRYDQGEMPESGPAGCDSDKCMLPEEKPINEQTGA